MIVASHGIIGSQIVQATGLLIEYPNAAAAYSLRLLRSTYTGSAIRVRRASDSEESDIGFAANELDTSALTTFCSGTNGFVKTWYDQSGNARDATQTTAANQPQIVSSGSVTLLNLKPTLQFNNNQILTRPSFGLSEISIFTVLKKYTMNTYSGYLRNVTDTGVSFSIGSRNNSTWQSQLVKFFNGVDTSPYIARFGIKSLPTNQYLENWIFNNSIQQLYENNTNQNTITGATGWAGLKSFSMGSISYTGNATAAKNEIQELIIYELNQSSNITAISTNINDFYSIY